MKKNFTQFTGLALAVLLQLLGMQAFAQTDTSRAVLRITIDGVATDYFSQDCGYGVANFGGGVNVDICAPLVWAYDITPDTLCCDSIPVGSLTGKIALVRRGTCGAGIKALWAQKAGAKAVIIANNSATAGHTDCSLPVLGGGSEGDATTIPVIYVCRAVANTLSAALTAGKTVNVCLLPPDIYISEYFYPPYSTVTPVTQIATDTFGFSVYLSNKGTATRNNIKITANVKTSNGTLLFTTDTIIPALDPGVVDSFVRLTKPYAPELGIGTYFINYSVAADAVGGDKRDGYTSPNAFYVSQDRYAKETFVTIGYRPGTVQDWYVGNVYQTSSKSLENYKATKAEFAFATNSGELAAGDVSSTLFLFRVKDNIPKDWAGFDNASVLSQSLDWVGTAVYEAPDNITSYTTQQVELLDFNTGNSGVPLDKGARYILIAGYTGASNVAFHAYNHYHDPLYTFVSSVVYTDRWYLGGFTGRPNAMMRMYIDLVTTTDETALPESVMNIVPNPVRETLNLALGFEKPTDATITIADINGRVIRIDDRDGLTNETLSYELPQLASGTYLARIATKEGTRTKKFVVQQ